MNSAISIILCLFGGYLSRILATNKVQKTEAGYVHIENIQMSFFITFHQEQLDPNAAVR